MELEGPEFLSLDPRFFLNGILKVDHNKMIIMFLEVEEFVLNLYMPRVGKSKPEPAPLFKHFGSGGRSQKDQFKNCSAGETKTHTSPLVAYVLWNKKIKLRAENSFLSWWWLWVLLVITKRLRMVSDSREPCITLENAIWRKHIFLAIGLYLASSQRNISSVLHEKM